jgi:hypothetical protein
LKDEERTLLKHVAEAADRKKKEEEKKEKAGPPRFELPEKQSLTDAALSADGRQAWLLIAAKADDAKTADVPDYVTETSYPAMIPTRNRVGDPQDTRRLAVLDLQTGQSAWATVDGVVAVGEKAKETAGADSPTSPASHTAAATEAPVEPEAANKAADAKPRPRELSWAIPSTSRDGRLAVASVRAADNKDRWLVVLDPATGKGGSTSSKTTRRSAGRSEAATTPSASPRRPPNLVPLRAGRMPPLR